MRGRRYRTEQDEGDGFPVKELHLLVLVLHLDRKILNILLPINSVVSKQDAQNFYCFCISSSLTNNNW